MTWVVRVEGWGSFSDARMRVAAPWEWSGAATSWALVGWLWWPVGDEADLAFGCFDDEVGTYRSVWSDGCSYGLRFAGWCGPGVAFDGVVDDLPLSIDRGLSCMIGIGLRLSETWVIFRTEGLCETI